MKNLRQFSLTMLSIIIGSLCACEMEAKPPVKSLPEPIISGIGYNAIGKQERGNGAITLATAFNNDYYTTNAGAKGSFYAELSAGASERPTDRKRIPLNLSIVIDRSGSMSGEKIQRAKEAAAHIVDQLSSSDYISIVSYDQQIKVEVPATHPHDKYNIKNAINRITSRGSTNLAGGAIEGYKEVKRKYNSASINRVILLSDGLANEGITNPEQIENIVKSQLYENGISISTFGLGRDYNENLMTAMAETGNGNYYFIDNANDISSIFRRELNGLEQVVAQNVTMKITLPENINVDKVYGTKYVQNGRELLIDLRDVFSNETKSILVKYTVNRNVNSPINMRTNLSYVDARTERATYLSTSNKQEFTNSMDIYNRHFSEWVMAQDILYNSNERLEMAMKAVDEGKYEDARKMVKENKQYIKDNKKIVEKNVRLQKLDNNNATYEERIKEAEYMPVEDKKVLQKASKAMNYEIRTKK